MEKPKQTTRREQQKAIDGILFGQDKPMPVRRPTPLVRGRSRAAQPSALNTVKPKAASRVAKKAELPDDEMPNVAPLDLSLDALEASKKAKKGKKERFNPKILLHPKQWNWRTVRKRGLLGLAGLVALILIVGGILVAKGYINLHKVLKGGGHSAVLKAHVNPIDVTNEGDGNINILLTGIGGGTHEGPDLTDTILIASIDPVNNKMSLLSIPRDLYVSMPGHGSMKINAVYETGKYAYLGHQDSSSANQKAVQAGFTSLDSMIQTVTGLHMNYNALVNFQAFQQAVNTVGGITVNVPSTLYDPTMAWENGGSSVLARAGVQTFDGAHALMYVRSRETSSDFARAQRQRAVMVSLMQKVFTLGTLSNPAKISSLLDAFGNNVVTNISISDLTRIYSLTKKIPEASIQSVGLADTPNNFVTTGMISGQSVVYPLAGLNNYAAIQNYVRNTIKDGYMLKENAKVVVLNGTTDATLATDKATILKSYGYNVTGTGNTPTQQYKKTVIVDLTHGKKPYTAQYLKHRLGVKSTTTTLPDKTIQTQNADFVIILGEDETTTSQN